MEKGELKTGQLLGIIEKNGKLVREYVAGFFGEEPIIKQRLLTPQETRRYREDVERGKSQGKSESEAASDAGKIRPGRSLGGRPGLKKRLVKPGMKLKKRPVSARGTISGETQGENHVRARPARGETQSEKSVPQPSYGNQLTGINDAFIQNLINGETDKPNFNPANRQKALTIINRIGSPEMKVYQIGTLINNQEGYFYTQKEYLVRGILGLPLWKPKPQVIEKKEETESPAEESVEPSKEVELVTVDETDTDAKFDA